MTEISEIIIEAEGDDPELWDVNAKGFCSCVVVKFKNNTAFRLDFIEPVRHGQEVRGDVEERREVMAEPEMVIIPEITRREMIKAVLLLERTNYFARRVPIGFDIQFDPAQDILIKSSEFEQTIA